MLGILGAGSWGTALALQSAGSGHQTLLWEFNPEIAARLSEERENRAYLPGIPFPQSLSVTGDLSQCIEECDTLLVAVPSAAFKDLMVQIEPALDRRRGIAWATKGLVPDGRMLYQVCEEILGEVPMGVLSGPSFAVEVAQQKPTAISFATNDDALGTRLIGYLHSDSFRVYTSSDLVGVSLGGAYKNVLAIAAGIADGLQLGHNARAGLVTRGLAEMQRLGQALGGQPETFMGLAGLGDLVLTCTGDLSRNRRLGLALAKGQALADIRREIGQVTEGVETAAVIHHLGQSSDTELPIATEVYGVLFAGKSPREAVANLLSREPRQEF